MNGKTMHEINHYIKSTFDECSCIVEIRTFELKEYVKDILIERHSFEILQESSKLSKADNLENYYYLHFEKLESKNLKKVLSEIDQDIVFQLVDKQTYQANGLYFCRCCGYNTLSEFPNGTYEICDICFWEDDWYQTENPKDKEGPNRVSLIAARRNFDEFGACEAGMKINVREPYASDIRRTR